MDIEKSILVTGGTGFLGSYLLRTLVQKGGKSIRATCRSNSTFELVEDIRHQVEWVECDIGDVLGLEEAMENVRQVYHCAALVSVDSRDDRRMQAVNRDGTANVVNAALYRGVDKMIHVSSIAAMGYDRHNPVITEQTTWQRDPRLTGYAISKYQAEMEAWRGYAEGLNLAVINPSIILGSGPWNEGPLQLFKTGWREFPFYPLGRAGFVDVRDVARFMIRLMESDRSGERYIVSSGNYSHREIQTMIARALDRRPPHVPLRPWIGRLAWRAEKLLQGLSGRQPFLTEASLEMATREFECDNQKSIRDLDFEYTPIQETIRQTAVQFREAAATGFSARVLPLLP